MRHNFDLLECLRLTHTNKCFVYVIKLCRNRTKAMKQEKNGFMVAAKSPAVIGNQFLRSFGPSWNEMIITKSIFKTKHRIICVPSFYDRKLQKCVGNRHFVSYTKQLNIIALKRKSNCWPRFSLPFSFFNIFISIIFSLDFLSLVNKPIDMSKYVYYFCRLDKKSRMLRYSFHQINSTKDTKQKQIHSLGWCGHFIYTFEFIV